MKLTSLNPNYNLAGGDHNFDGIQIAQDNDTVAIQVEYANLNAADVKAVIYQNVDNSAILAPMEDTEVTLSQAKAGHVWNLAGVAKGSYIKVGLIVGSATVGTISKIKYLN